jgi:hypothetical protein
MSLIEFVSEQFGEFRCYGHCDQPATMKFLYEDDDKTLIAVTVCHSAYASRIIAYGRNLELERLKSLMTRALDRRYPLNEADIRTATRFAWEIQGLGLKEGVVMRAAYWTQNYRGNKTDDPNRTGLFVCSSCDSFFLQPMTKKEILCSGCLQS